MTSTSPLSVLSALALLGICSVRTMTAQEPPCGLSKMTEGTAPDYSPIGRAAHVEGTVILIASFSPDGKVLETRIVSGPKVLEGAADHFVRGWKANAYGGERNCPVVVKYRLVGTSVECDTIEDHSQKPSIPFARSDFQHVTISARSGCYTVTRDPASYKEHHFLFHRWYSKSA